MSDNQLSANAKLPQVIATVNCLLEVNDIRDDQFALFGRAIKAAETTFATAEQVDELHEEIKKHRQCLKDLVAAVNKLKSKT